MKDFIKELLFNGWIGRIVLVVIVVTIGLIGYVVIYLPLDTAFCTKLETTATITNKYIVPAYSTTTFINSGKSLIPVTTYNPELYEVKIITINGESAEGYVSKQNWNEVVVNKNVAVTYHKGRISGNIYIDEIRSK
jgi:hypothetical protein